MPSVSQAQQRYFGAIKGGAIARPKGMSTRVVDEFASTPRKGLPEHLANGRQPTLLESPSTNPIHQGNINMTNTAFQQNSRNRMPPAHGQKMPNNMSGAPMMANGGKANPPSWMERSQQMMADGCSDKMMADGGMQDDSRPGPGRGGYQKPSMPPVSITKTTIIAQPPPKSNLITPASGFKSNNRPMAGNGQAPDIQPTNWGSGDFKPQDTPHMADGGIGKPAPVSGDVAPYRVRRNVQMSEPDMPEEGSEVSPGRTRRYFGQSQGSAPDKAGAPATMMADGGKWAAEAFGSNKGGLHRALGVPEGKKIPEAKKIAATHSKNSHLRHMAQAAVNI